MKFTAMLLIGLAALLSASGTLYAYGETPTQKCIKSFYEECGYKFPKKAGVMTTNECMREKISYCYCEYQSLNCQ